MAYIVMANIVIASMTAEGADGFGFKDDSDKMLFDAAVRSHTHDRMAHTHARTHARTHTCTHARVCAHARTHAHMHAHTHGTGRVGCIVGDCRGCTRPPTARYDRDADDRCDEPC